MMFLIHASRHATNNATVAETITIKSRWPFLPCQGRHMMFLSKRKYHPRTDMNTYVATPQCLECSSGAGNYLKGSTPTARLLWFSDDISTKVSGEKPPSQ
eukprot:3405543-Amphidinium_carterae.1